MATREQERRFALLDKNNLYWAGFIAFAAAALGSAVSILLAVTFVWSAIYKLRGLCNFRHTESTLYGSLICATYALVILSFSITQSEPNSILLSLGLVMFFAPLGIAPRLLYSQPDKLFQYFVLGAALGTISVSFVALYQMNVQGLRAEGIAGNANVFGTITALLGCLGALSLSFSKRWQKLLGALSLIAMVVCVIASGMRAMWLAVPLLLIIVFWACMVEINKKTLLSVSAALLLGIVSVTVIFGQTLGERFSHWSKDIDLVLEQKDYNSSTGLRIILLEAGIKAVLKDPLTGYGIAGRMKAVNENVDVEKFDRKITQTHPHNGFLAAALDAGFLGFLSVVMLIFCPAVLVFREDQTSKYWRQRMAAALILTVTFVATGLSNILFQHDIMDSVFISTLTLILATATNPKWQIR